jgi:hypothetical protein
MPIPGLKVNQQKYWLNISVQISLRHLLSNIDIILTLKFSPKLAQDKELGVEKKIASYTLNSFTQKSCLLQKLVA